MSAEKKQIAFMLVGQALTMAFSLALPIYFARVLTTSEFGIYSQFNFLLIFLTTLLGFGFSSELFYFYPRGNEYAKRNIVAYSFLALILLGVVSYIVIYVTPLFGLLVSEVGELQAAMLLLVIMLTLPSNIMTALYVVRHDNLMAVLYQPAFAMLKLLLLAGAIFIFKSSNYLYYAFLILTIVQFFFVAIYVAFAIKNVGGRIKYDPALLKSQMKYVVPLGAGNSLKIISDQFDRMIMMWSVSAASFGLYAVVIFGIPGVQQIYLTFSQVYLKTIVSALESRNSVAAIDAYKNMLSIIMSYTIPIIFFVAFYAESIVRIIFSDKYVGVAGLYSAYLVTIFFSSLGSGIFLKALDRTRQIFLSYFLTIIISGPATFFLIREYSLSGGVASAVISCVLQRVFLIYFDSKAMKVRIRDMFPIGMILRITVGAVGALAFVAIFGRLDKGIGGMAVLFFCYLFWYIVFAYKLGVLRIFWNGHGAS